MLQRRVRAVVDNNAPSEPICRAHMVRQATIRHHHRPLAQAATASISNRVPPPEPAETATITGSWGSSASG